MRHPIQQLVLAQIRGFVREPGILFWAFGFPVAMAWVLGIAFDRRKEAVQPVALIQMAESPGPLALRLIESKEILARPMQNDEALRSLKKGDVQALVFEKSKREILIQYDPANQEAATAKLKIENILSQKKITIKTERLTAIGSRYVDYLVPGLLAMSVMNACLWGTGWVMIEFRIKKLLRAMVASSMSKVHFLISFFISRIIANVAESGLLLLFAWLYFSLTIQGSIAAFLLVILSGIAAFSGIAVFSASRASSTQVANGILNALTLPLTILSGIFFSYHYFPEWLVSIIRYLPLTLLADSVRSIFIEGAGIPEILIPCAFLWGIGTFFFYAGLRIYRWY